MTIQRLTGDTIGLKIGSTTVQLKSGGMIRIGDYPIEGPGEYDIAGVGVHAFEQYAILFAEGVRFASVWGSPETIRFEENTNIDIFILFLEDVKQITTIIKEQDPRVVVVTQETVAEGLAKQDGVLVDRQSSYKVTAQSLPAGERLFILV